MVNARGNTEIEMFFDDITSNVTYVFEADTRVVFTLWFWVTDFRPTEWATVFVQEVFL